MTKPTDEELKIALGAAIDMREHKKDHNYIAKSLLNMNYRLHYYEKVFSAAERYIYFGMEQAEHQELMQAIEDVRAMELKVSNEDSPPLLGM